MVYCVLKYIQAWERKEKGNDLKIKMKAREWLGVVAHSFNPSTWETEAGRPL